MNAERAVRVVFIASLLVLAGTLVAAWQLRVPMSEHTAYVDGLRQMSALHARLHEQILRAHAGVLGNYDGIDATVRATETTLAGLAEPPAFTATEERSALAVELARTRALFAQEAAQVEQFKSELAVLRNSVRYFPLAARERAAALETGGAPNAEARALEVLATRVLEVSTFPDAERARAVEVEVGLLRAQGHDEARERLLRHADVVTDRSPRVGRLLRDILAVPMPDAVERHEALYESAFQAARERQDVARATVALTLLFVVALGGLTVILRMRASARELARASERLRLSLEQQHRFVSMTSHEFRTPLSVIMSSTDLLDAYGGRWDLDQRRKHLARITRAARGMTDLLDGLLLIGRTDAGHVELRPTRTNLLDLMQEVVEAQRLRAKNGVTLELTHDLGERPLRLDPRLFRHIADNLVSNAVKYSKPKGAVRVHLAVEGAAVYLNVADEGIGIPAADLDRLFSSFHRSENVGLVPGTGLGLAIVKRALDQHKGTIEVESTVDVGTTFRVRVPVELLDPDDVGTSSEGGAP